MDTDGRDPPGEASRHGHAPPSPSTPDGRGVFPVRQGSWQFPLGSCAMTSLVLLRHGESAWNAEGLFTGWVDVGLSGQGATEATAGGRLLRDAGVRPDVVHTSVLTRAIRAAKLALESADLLGLPVRRSWRLNERHYGA